jgi:hypothetical protein
MTEDYIQLPLDGSGKKQRTIKATIGANTVHAEVVSIADPTIVTQVLAVDAAGRIGVNNLPGAVTSVKIEDATVPAQKLAVDVDGNGIIAPRYLDTANVWQTVKEDLAGGVPRPFPIQLFWYDTSMMGEWWPISSNKRLPVDSVDLATGWLDAHFTDSIWAEISSPRSGVGPEDEIDYTWNADGSMATETHKNAISGNIFLLTYTWNADRTLQKIVRTDF